MVWTAGFEPAKYPAPKAGGLNHAGPRPENQKPLADLSIRGAWKPDDWSPDLRIVPWRAPARKCVGGLHRFRFAIMDFLYHR